MCNLLSTSFKTPVRPMWYCGAGLVGVERLVYGQQLNQTRVRLFAQRESGPTVTRGDLTVTVWRKAKNLLQSSEMGANVSVVA